MEFFSSYRYNMDEAEYQERLRRTEAMKEDNTLRGFIFDAYIFVIIVTLNLVVGLLARYFRTNAFDKQSYSFATGSVSSFAVLLSIARTGIGIRIFLGIPAEMYYRGSGMWESLYGIALALPLVGFVMMPVYFAMPTTSIYQYLELRFGSSTVRRLASMMYLFRSVMMLGITVLTPSIAVNAVTGIPYFASIVIFGVACIILNAFGGMRSIIIADVLQAVVLFACIIAIISRALYKLQGDLPAAFHVADERGRMNFFNFDLDPTKRITTVSAIIGQTVTSMSVYGCNQAFAQKYRSLPNQKTVVRTLLAASPVIAFLESLVWFAGVFIFAVYADCDPMTAGKIDAIDELGPFFVAQELSIIPGVLGLYMASLINGAMGVGVTVLNSLATVTWEDYFSYRTSAQSLTDKEQLTRIRQIGAMYAVVMMVTAVVIAQLPGILEASQLISSTLSGPLLGVFLLALLVPAANKKGTVFGIIVSFSFNVFMAVGRVFISHPSSTFLPVSTSHCPVEWNVTQTVSFVNSRYEVDIMRSYYDISGTWLLYVFSISYMYYALIGCGVCMATGITVSYLTRSEDDVCDERLIHPFVRKLMNKMNKTSAVAPTTPTVPTVSEIVFSETSTYI